MIRKLISKKLRISDKINLALWPSFVIITGCLILNVLTYFVFIYPIILLLFDFTALAVILYLMILLFKYYFLSEKITIKFIEKQIQEENNGN